MTISLHLLRLVKDHQDNIMKEGNESKPKEKEAEKEVQKINTLSPKTIRKNLSNDNFLKFQWPWTV
jgi:hypothetical protein